VNFAAQKLSTVLFHGYFFLGIPRNSLDKIEIVYPLRWKSSMALVYWRVAQSS
jgi:hypothetical protein